jgi:hypothetical protein
MKQHAAPSPDRIADVILWLLAQSTSSQLNGHTAKQVLPDSGRDLGIPNSSNRSHDMKLPNHQVDPIH